MKFLSSLLAALIFATQLTGYMVPGFREFVLEGEYLRINPTLETTGYVIRTEAAASLIPDKRSFNRGEWMNGVRIAGVYGLAPNRTSHLTGSWRHFSDTSRDTTGSSGADLLAVALPGGFGAVPAAPFNGSASSRLHLNYNDGDLLIHEPICSFSCFKFYIIAGAQYIAFDYFNNITYASVTDGANYTLRYETELRGGGAKFGFDVFYDLPKLRSWGRTGIHGQLTGSTLMTRNRAIFRYDETATPTSIRMGNGNIITTVVAAEARLGFNFYRDFCWGRWAVEIGGDFAYFSNAIDQVTFTSFSTNDPGNSFDDYSAFGFSGIFINLGVNF